MARSISSSFASSLKFPLLSITLVLVYIYLILKTFYQGFSENALRDEGIGGKCSCKSKVQMFYQAIYGLACACVLVYIRGGSFCLLYCLVRFS